MDAMRRSTLVRTINKGRAIRPVNLLATGTRFNQTARYSPLISGNREFFNGDNVPAMNLHATGVYIGLRRGTFQVDMASNTVRVYQEGTRLGSFPTPAIEFVCFFFSLSIPWIGIVFRFAYS